MILQYPFDYTQIIRKKKSLKRQLAEQPNLKELKVAILGGSATQEVREMIELFLLNRGIKAIVYEAGYNQYYVEALFGENLRLFGPDIVYVHTSVRNISEIPTALDSEDDVRVKLEKEYEKICEVLTALSRLDCSIIINNYEFMEHRNFGNYDSQAGNGTTSFILELNRQLAKEVKARKGVYLQDLNYLSAQIGLLEWFDLPLWFNFKYAMSFKAMIHIAHNLSTMIDAIYGEAKKVLALDLDNTLWGGVIGDDGVNNIALGMESALGEAHFTLQNYVKNLSNRGIVLTISSKNDEANGKEGLAHRNSLLEINDFSDIQINWREKYINLQKSAENLNLGLDSFVFLDDNPIEREQVRSALPEVAVPNVGSDASYYARILEMNQYFEQVTISTEDLHRKNYYLDNAKRKEEKEKFLHMDDFLASLEMKAEIMALQPNDEARTLQLINKTNQFNTTTRRFTEEEFFKYKNKEEIRIVTAKLTDRFGDNGLVSTLLATFEQGVATIDNWVMSCRVFQRGLEFAIFNEFVKLCNENGVKLVKGRYIPSAKNKLIERLFEQLGFQQISSNESGHEWTLATQNYEFKAHKILVNEEIELC